MPLQDKDIARIKADVETVVRSLHAAHLARGEGTLEHFLAFFEEDVIGVGTGLDEVVYNKKDLTTLLEREWGETPQSLHYVLHSVEVRVLSAESASAQSFLDIYLGEPDGPSLFARLTTVFRKVDGEWRGVHWHASTPWEIQPEGVSWPTDELEARARKLQEQVDARTQALAKANRELEVDAALERIRRMTGEMKDPSDLVEVVKQIKVEANSLYGGSIVEVGLVQEADSETLRFWSIIDVNEVPEDLAQFGLLYPKKPDPTHPMVDRVWAADEQYANLFFDLDAMWQIHTSLAHYNPPEADVLKAALDGGMQGGWVTVCAVQVGRMYLSWSAEPPEEVASAQPRIAAVLTEAQQRVEELRHAQQLAREAEINLAVEKVRARATGMQSPDDLTLVMKQLKMEVDRLWGGAVQELSISQHHDEDQLRFWVILDADNVPDSLEEFGQFFPKRPDPPHPTVERALQQTESFSKSHIHREELLANIKSLEYYFPHYAKTTRPLVESAKVLELWYTTTPIHDGWIAMAWGDDPPSEVESIQRRLADVLDEALRRVDELRKAQHMAREAEINLAVEKVRARASGMQTSGEIVDVADVLREQLLQLGLSDVMACTVYTRTPSGKHRVSEMARLEEGSTQFSFDWIFDPVDLNPQVMVHDFLAAETTTVFHEDAEAMALLMKEALKYDPDYTEDYQQAMDEGGISEMWVAVCPSDSVRLCIDFKIKPPEEILSILPRMAQAFDHAYRRHQDLERAEAQTREAQVEAALERIRSRTIGMQSSDELAEVSLVLDKEIRGLGTKTWGCAFNIYGEEESTEWFGGETGIQNPYKTPRERFFKEFYEKGQEGETLYIKEFSGDECSEHYDYMKTLPVMGEMLDGIEEAGHSLPSSQIDHVAYFKYGYLLFITLEPAPEAHDIFKRFAKVFEQTYTRFLDLRRAEAQAREAQIEAALERVRGRALAMRSSQELDEVAEELRHQMGLLGQTDLEVCAIHIYDTEGDDFESWGAMRDPAQKDNSIHQEVRLFPKKGVAILEQVIAAYESDENNHVFVNDASTAPAFFQMLQERAPGVLEKLMAFIPPDLKPEDMKAWWSFSDFSGGSIGIVTYKPADAESLDLLERTAGVFDLAYRRFKDLREAEEAQREAQIEAALERVRSRSLAMQSSGELMEVAQVLFRQLIELGLDPAIVETCGFVIFDTDSTIGETFITQPDGSSLMYTFRVNYGGDRVTKGQYDAWKRGDRIHLETIVGQDLPDHLAYLASESGQPIDRFHEMSGKKMPAGSYNYSSNFTHGFVVVITTEPQEEASALYPRFAKVFEQAYTRFLDLQRAENAARESQIEAALERVRAVATAMRSSDELLKVMQHIHREFSGLGFPCGAFWNSRYLETHYEKAVTGMGGEQVTAIMELPRDFSMIPELAAWERSTEKLGIFKFGTEASIEYLNHMIEKGKFLEIVPGVLTEELLREKGGWTFVQARTTHGELGYNLWGETDPSEEATDTLLRFAAVFDLAFRRFIDLEEAEAQARESQIEAALERVRAQAMAMQKPEDISDVSIRLFDEMEALGIESLRSGVSIAGEGERYEFHAATKDESGSTMLVLGDESVNVHPVIRRAYDGWREQETHQISVLEGKDLLDYYHAVFDTMPLPDWKERMQRGQEAMECFATFPFQDGWLYTFTRHEIMADEVQLHERFARVFGLAYQRYHDLTKAQEDYQALLAEKARTEKALTDLQATQKQLVEQEKLASLGSLTAGIAHEIKNPLNFVNNFAEVSTELMEELAEAVASGNSEEAAMILDDLRDNATQIAKHGKRADSIVRSMMQHARGGASDIETIVVNDFLEEYANLAWHGMRARDHGFNADVERDFDPGAGSLNVMPQELGRVVLNLLNNAFDAVKDQNGGMVRVGSKRSSDALTITVSDNGPGIPEDIRQKIFEPFFTTKATGEGTGLGLSLSYDIVTKGHGGTMTVGESPDGGALFTVTIPGGAA